MLSSGSVRIVTPLATGARELLGGVGKPSPHVRLGTGSLGLSKMELQIGGGIRILSQTFGTRTMHGVVPDCWEVWLPKSFPAENLNSVGHLCHSAEGVSSFLTLGDREPRGEAHV